VVINGYYLKPLVHRNIKTKECKNVMDESVLEVYIRDSWIRETSSEPNWTPENPAFGQCAVTALIVNDYLGGKIVWAEAVNPEGSKISHYFNTVDGKVIDFTRCQFPEGTTIPAGIDKTKGFPTTRDYVLSFEATRKRYEILKQRVDDLAKSTENYI
jgi:hypothetical protein